MCDLVARPLIYVSMTMKINSSIIDPMRMCKEMEVLHKHYIFWWPTSVPHKETIGIPFCGSMNMSHSEYIKPLEKTQAFGRCRDLIEQLSRAFLDSSPSEAQKFNSWCGISP